MIAGLLAGLLFGKTGYYLLLSWCCVSIVVFMVRAGSESTQQAPFVVGQLSTHNRGDGLLLNRTLTGLPIAVLVMALPPPPPPPPAEKNRHLFHTSLST